MLLPINIDPRNSLYYYGAIVLCELKKRPSFDLMTLFSLCKNRSNVSFESFLLTLDWLFLIRIIETNGKGELKLCI